MSPFADDIVLVCIGWEYLVKDTRCNMISVNIGKRSHLGGILQSNACFSLIFYLPVAVKVLTNWHVLKTIKIAHFGRVT